MTKTKISVEIYQPGKLNEFIYRQIESFNSGQIVIDKYGFISCIVMQGHISKVVPAFQWDESKETVFISEKGIITLALTWKELEELETADLSHDPDDLKEVFN